MQTITIDLPEEIYRRAKQIAEISRRPIEQVVVDWIHPPHDEQSGRLDDLDEMSDQDLRVEANRTLPDAQTERLAQLLQAQRERALTTAERNEAEALVKKEDWLTLRRARALYLLKQRGNLPDDFPTPTL